VGQFRQERTLRADKLVELIQVGNEDSRAMHHADTDPLSVQRNLVLGLLLALAAMAWALLALQSSSGEADMTMSSPTMGMDAPLFLAIWVVMMVAMMFPTAAPMILTFHRIQAGKRERGDTFVATWIFVAAYMVIWTLAGVAAYLGALAAEALATWAALSSTTAARIGGVILIAAGLYQLSPLKDLCLSKCRTPIAFIMTSWRDGTTGALRMGLLHGAYCLGCCWLLLAAVRSAVPAWHDEHRRDGLHHGADLRREDTTLGTSRSPDCGGRSFRLWRLGVGRAATAADIRIGHDGDARSCRTDADALRRGSCRPPVWPRCRPFPALLRQKRPCLLSPSELQQATRWRV
jgi:predicted metal-binding membrane protein